MSLFDQYIFKNFSNLMERSTDVADLGKLSPEDAEKLLGISPQRGAANRFGKYTNEDVAPFLKNIISTILKNPSKKISYADLTDIISKAISSPEYKYEFEGESGSFPGLRMASSFADKWTQNLANTIFTTIQGLQSGAVSRGENVSQSDMKQALTQAIKKFEDKNPTPAEIADGTAETEKSPEQEPSPSEAPSSVKPEEEKEEAAELGLSDIENAVLTAIETEGPIDNNKLATAVDRDLIPQQYKDSDASIKSFVRQIAQGLGRKKLIKRTDTGWEFIPQSASGSTLGELGDEEEQEADAERAKQAELAYLQRQMMGGMTSRSPLEDSVNFSDVYLNIFKSKGLING